MTEQQKQAWRNYFSQLRHYQLDLNSYYYDLVEWLAARNGFPIKQEGDDDDEDSNPPPPNPPLPPRPPGS